MMTWNELMNGTEPEDDYDLAVLSDKLWEMGSVEAIKKAVSPEVFQLFIAMNAIGNWEGEGWGCFIGDHPELQPYIAEALDYAGFSPIAEAFRNVLKVFPDFTVFQDDQTYCDIVNFLQSPRFKVKNECLDSFSVEERKAMSKQFIQGIDKLEDATESFWDDGKGWGVILRRVAEHTRPGAV